MTMRRAVRNGRLTINVKCPTAYRWADNIEATDSQRERAWNFTQRAFWDDAERLAQEHGYAGVYSAGRSDGWLIPYRNATFAEYRYPDPNDAEDCERFERFAESVEALLNDAPTFYADTLAEIVREDDREDDEAARQRAAGPCTDMGAGL